eukprot:1034589-Rhodomonas_salina.1
MVTKPDFSIRGTFNQTLTQHMSGHHRDTDTNLKHPCRSASVRPSCLFHIRLTLLCPCNISTLMTAAPSPAAFLARH